MCYFRCHDATSCTPIISQEVVWTEPQRVVWIPNSWAPGRLTLREVGPCFQRDTGQRSADELGVCHHRDAPLRGLLCLRRVRSGRDQKIRRSVDGRLDVEPASGLAGCNEIGPRDRLSIQVESRAGEHDVFHGQLVRLQLSALTDQPESACSTSPGRSSTSSMRLRSRAGTG